jgi:hypothetical protein
VLVLKLISEIANYLSWWDLVLMYMLVLKLISEFADYLSS